MSAIVGRARELAALADWREGPAQACASLVAAPGLGKTAVVEAFLAGLDPERFTVLRARPLETEAALGFSALAELLAPLPVETYDDLPPPQRTGLRSALLLDEAPAADPRAVAAGLRTVLCGIAGRRPVVLVVDDAHWLDHATAAALAQALRRLPQVPVHVLAAARPAGRRVEEWLPPWPRTDLELTPLEPADVFVLLRDRLGVTLDRSQLRAVMEGSGGNPLHALELARHRLFGGGASFESLLTGRLLALPRPTRRALLAAALASRPSDKVLGQALGVDPVRLGDVLEPASADGLVRLSDEVRFLHPLYREAAVTASPPAEQAAMHVRLADAEPLDAVRVRHRALASSYPDPGLGEDLAAQAARSDARGAWAEAADLLRLSIDHTTDPARRHERMAALAARLIAIGSPAPAEQLLRQVSAEATGDLRWEAAIELASLLVISGRTDEAVEIVHRILDADLPPALRAAAVIQLEPEWLLGRADRNLASAHEANAVLAGLPDAPGLARLRSRGLALEFRLRVEAALPGGDLLERALELEQREPPAELLESASMIAAKEALLDYRHDEARQRIASLTRRAEQTGDDAALPFLHSLWAYLEWRAGRLDVSLRVSEAGERIAESMAAEFYRPLLAIGRATVYGLQGELDAALTLLRESASSLEQLDDGFASIYWAAQGRVLVVNGRAEEGLAAIERADIWAARGEWHDPADRILHSEHVDALLALGLPDAAEATIERTAELARRLGRDPVLTELARGRVALLAARGDLEAAAAAVPAMLAGFEGRHRPMELGSAWLTAGRVHRRLNSRRLAHEELTQARLVFEQIGCAPYAAQASAELARVGLRPRAPATLTATERQVAELAAQGLRNAEIAERAFLAPKTVESVLTRCYRKLGIRSRAGLARALAGTPED